MWTATLGNSRTQVPQQKLQALEILPLTSHLQISGRLVRKLTRPERVPFGSHRVMIKDHHLRRIFIPVMADAVIFKQKKNRNKKKKPRIFDTDDYKRLR